MSLSLKLDLDWLSPGATIDRALRWSSVQEIIAGSRGRSRRDVAVLRALEEQLQVAVGQLLPVASSGQTMAKVPPVGDIPPSASPGGKATGDSRRLAQTAVVAYG